MFEISVAFKYLLPRKKQLSVSLISLMSILVISLVVWLVLVFLSVTEGIEKKWLDKLTSLNAPLRITPTHDYYSSYYYQIDSASSSSHFQNKSIFQKSQSFHSDPYSSEEDGELPLDFPLADRKADGTLKDPVKEVFAILGDLKKNTPDLVFQDFELGGALLRLQLLRSESQVATGKANKSQSFLTQVSYIASFPDQSPYVQNLILPIRSQDLNHMYFMAPHALDHSREDAPAMMARSSSDRVAPRLKALAEHAAIRSLKTTYPYWKLPRELLPQKGQFQAALCMQNGKISHVSIPAKNVKSLGKAKTNVKEGVLLSESGLLSFRSNNNETYSLPVHTPLIVEGTIEMRGSLIKESLEQAGRLEEIRFAVQASLQGSPIEGEIFWEGVEIAQAEIQTDATTPSLPWVGRLSGKGRALLPINDEKETGVLLAKNFQDNGVLIGDRGYLSYSTSTTSSIQEQRLPIFVAGFYDPGVMSIGAKCILVPPTVAHTISSSSSSFNLDKTQSNGISVWFKNIQEAHLYKEKICAALTASGIDAYWKVTTFREYDFAKDLLEQFQSDQYLFTLVGVIILVVACCNIISLLVLLVNDKKREIGILQAMGASSKSIAMIFGTCGVSMGILSSLIGTVAALFTLQHIDAIVHLLSLIQGHDAFNAAFFGSELPNQLSHRAVIFVLVATPVLSLCAGLVPAIKACRLRPSAILRSE
ncbi:MAG: ABC transporter permease [Parachlamydiales bacterium]|nr:ABC transporter permease [Verrucomicrobiota bacterium]